MVLEKESLDIKTKRIEELRKLLPELFVEGKLDVNKLHDVIGEYVEAGNERYSFTWAGKNLSLRIRDKRSKGTLVPSRKESINFDETSNIFIEGENLEVLKILQKSYQGQVKLIYIDPPYNTGKDFIYKDDYSDSLKEYLRYTGQSTATGEIVTTNPETSGRFHSNWLSMMYPRLFLAQYLLKPEGIIFVSIDDNEVHNLRQIMNEVFGPENFVCDITVVNNLKGRSDKKYIAVASEHLLMYRKSEEADIIGLPITPETLEEYKLIDPKNGKRYRLGGLRKRGANSRRQDRKNLYYPIYVDPLTESVSTSRDEKHTIEVVPKLSNGEDGCWRWEKLAVEERNSELAAKLVKRKKQNQWDVFQKDYLFKDGEERRIKMKSFIMGSDYSTDTATTNLRGLFDGKKVFDNPKSPWLIKDLVQYATEKNDLILDFTAGSGTTAHAVLSQNVADDGHRKFIMIQFPEPTPEDSDAFKMGYKTIAEVCKERLRRVIKRIKEEQSQQKLVKSSTDLGFKVFKLSKSSCFVWDGSEISDQETLARQIEESAKGASSADKEALVFELMLREGFKLDSGIQQLSDNKNNFYKITDEEHTLWMCFDKRIDEENVKKLELSKDDKLIVLDSALNDTQKVNLTRKSRIETV